jgi:hypothetical protein
MFLSLSLSAVFSTGAVLLGRAGVHTSRAGTPTAASIAVPEASQLAQLARMTTLSIDTGDLDIIKAYGATGLITDATTNPLFVSQAGLSGDARYIAFVDSAIAYAKKNPNALSYATPGTGTGTHLAGEMLASMAGIKLLHIPYKGSAPAQQDMIGGRVPLLFDVLFSSMPFVKDNRMKVIALSSPKRAVSSPEIPLIAETVPGFSAVSAIGIIAPAGMPPALLQKISADIGQVVRSAEVVARMQQLGMEPVGSTSEQYTNQIRQDIDKWAAIVKSAVIKLE